MVYSSYELAIESAQDKVEELECDLYLCEVNHPSGKEYTLKRSICEGFSYLKYFELPFKHHFVTEKSARKASKVVEKKRGKKIGVRAKYETVKGYKVLLYFYLVEQKT